MNHLRELYQEVIVDHNKNPRNFGALENANHHADGFNPLCGDKVSIDVLLQNDIIRDVHFTGKGCAISIASASLMTEILKGKTLKDAANLFTHFHEVLTEDKKIDLDLLGKLAVLAGVKEYPSRVKCATLAWHAFNAALEDYAKPVSTE